MFRVLLALLAMGGSCSIPTTQDDILYNPADYATPEQSVKAGFDVILRSQSTEPAPRSPAYQFILTNIDEILKTLEVVEVVKEDPFAVAFVRVSVGTTMCRRTYVYQLANNMWVPAGFPYYHAEYNPLDYTIHRDHQEFIVAMRVKMGTWTEDQPECWWL